MDKKRLAEEAVGRASASFGKAEELGEALRHEYMAALERLQRDVADFYARYGAANGLSYADAVKYLSKVELRSWREKLEEYTRMIDEGDLDLLAEIKTLDAKEKITRLENLMLGIRTELARLGIDEREVLLQHLTDTFQENYEGAFAGIKGAAEAKASFARINPELIRETVNYPWSGESFSEIIWNNTNRLARELKSELTQGFIRGTSVQKMASGLAKRMDGGYKAALRVVRTESAHVLNKAALMGYADAGVTSVEFLAVLDNRTSALCFNLNGDIIPLKNAVPGKNMPPLHPNCRSTIIPVVDDVKDKVAEESELLPNYDKAVIPDEKIAGYALNKEHPRGKNKAIVFEKVLGYNQDNYKQLIDDIKKNLSFSKALERTPTKHGRKFEVNMDVTGITGRTTNIRTGWIIENDSDIPRLTTVYIDKEK